MVYGTLRGNRYTRSGKGQPSRWLVVAEKMVGTYNAALAAGYNAALAAGIGAIGFEGKMIDNPVVAQACDVLRRADLSKSGKSRRALTVRASAAAG